MPSLTEKNPHLRPLDPRKDLNGVADLIDICFDFHMDEDGREYVRQIRRVAQSQNSLLGMSQNIGQRRRSHAGLCLGSGWKIGGQPDHHPFPAGRPLAVSDRQRGHQSILPAAGDCPQVNTVRPAIHPGTQWENRLAAGTGR